MSEGTINGKTKVNIIKQFANITPFEYDEEYLILHFEKLVNENDNFVEFDIQELGTKFCTPILITLIFISFL